MSGTVNRDAGESLWRARIDPRRPARAIGVHRIVAQSYALYRFAREGGPVETEDVPPDPAPPASMRQTVATMNHLDQAVTGAGGTALRYGNLYGDPHDGLVAAVRERKFPLVGNGGSVWSHLHLEDAAAATVLVLKHDGPAIYTIVDDEPAPIREWLPEFARILGAKPPQHFLRLLARLFAGEAAVVMATESRGASNAKAKREIGWTPRYPPGAKALSSPMVRRPLSSHSRSRVRRRRDTAGTRVEHAMEVFGVLSGGRGMAHASPAALSARSPPARQACALAQAVPMQTRWDASITTAASSKSPGSLRTHHAASCTSVNNAA